MNKALLISFLLILSISTFGQYTYYREAVVTKNTNEKITGYVEKISESLLYPKIKFKTDFGSNDFEEIPVTDIKELLFVSDSSIFETIPYIHTIDTTKITEYRLAKKIVDGQAQLYKLQLTEKEVTAIFEHDNTYLYILHFEDDYHVLNQVEELDGTSYKLRKNYQGKLIYLLRNHKELQDRARNLRFTDSQFISLIDDLNKRYSNTKKIAYSPKGKIVLKHEAGLGYSTFYSAGTIYGRGPVIGYNLGLINTAFSEKLSTNFGLFWHYYNRIDRKDNYQFLRIPIGLTYRFNNNRISPYLKGGVSIYLYENILHDQDLSMFVDFLINARLGVVLFKKFDINLEYDLTPNPIIQSNSFMHLNVGYIIK